MPTCSSWWSERGNERARCRSSTTRQSRARPALGLPMREIAQAAGVTHGTIRAINNRLASQTTGSEEQVMDDPHEAQPDEWDVQMTDEFQEPPT